MPSAPLPAPVNLQGAYNNGPGSIQLSSAHGGISISDAGTPLGVPLLNVTDVAGTTHLLEVDGSGNGGPAVSSYGPLAYGAAAVSFFDLSNTSVATSGVKQQWSPFLGLNGTAWNGTVSKEVGFRLGTKTQDGSGSVSGQLAFQSTVDGVTFGDVAYLGTAGNFGIGVSGSALLYGNGHNLIFQSGTGSTDPSISIGPNPGTQLGILDLYLNSNLQVSWGQNAFHWKLWTASLNSSRGFWIDTDSDFTADATQALFEVSTLGTHNRLDVYGNPSQAVVVTGTIYDTTGAQLTVKSSTETSPYHGANINLDATAVSGTIWRLLNLHEDPTGLGTTNALYLATASAGIAIHPTTGTIYPFNTTTGDLGSSGKPWRSGYFSKGTVTVDAAGTLSQTTPLLSLVDSTLTDTDGETPFRYFEVFPIPIGSTSGGGIRGWDIASFRQVISIWGGDTTVGNFDTLVRIEPSLKTGLAAGEFIFRSQDAAVGSNGTGGPIVIVGGIGDGSGPAGTTFIGGPGTENAVPIAPYICTSNFLTSDGSLELKAFTNLGVRLISQLSTGGGFHPMTADFDSNATPGLVLSTSLGEHFIANEKLAAYQTYDTDNASHTAFTVEAHANWTAGKLAQFVTNVGGTPQVRAEVYAGPSSINSVGTIRSYGNLTTAAFGGQLELVAVVNDGAFKGAGIHFNTAAVSGVSWEIASGDNANSLAGILALYNNSYQGIYLDATSVGSLSKRLSTGTTDLGSTDHFRHLYLDGLAKVYNGFTTDGVGLPYVQKQGLKVASSGAGAQTTTVLSQTVDAEGLFTVDVIASVTTGDTVSVQLTWTDGNNTTAQTVNVLPGDAGSGVAMGANSVLYASIPIEANTTTPVAVTIKISSHNTTKVSACLTRKV